MRLQNAFLFCCILLFICDLSFAQAFEQLEFRNVGPYRGGRVTAVAGTQQQPGTFYLGATGGGVWKTTDYGTSWDNVSDGYFETPSIGALAIAPNDPNVVYVGTGSDGLRSNVIAGKGVYKSIDGGLSWEHIGLKKVGQIGAFIIHPANHNIAYVAAVGQAFEPNPERGVFKTTDGGNSWEKVLFISDKVGFSDVEFLPGNPEILFAAAWKAERKPWTIISGGTQEEGGIYKSIDGGKNWRKLSEGLPQGLIGKIDVALCSADSRVVYALIEAPGDEGGVYKSMDQGKTFEQVSSFGGVRTRPFYYTNLRVDPTNSEVLYGLATGYYKSVNGGKDWNRIGSPHGDNHDMWINPDNPMLFIQSNDGGANVTHNGGISWSTQFNQPTAEIYQVEVDDQFPYWLYGGQQDNYTTIAVPSMPPYGNQTGGIGYIINTGGCETGPAVPKPGNPNIVYSNCKGRFGVFDKRTGIERSYYVGASNMYGHNPKDLKYRFQRVSPIHVSPHNPDVVYHASQFVHRTTDDGVTWETISPDLTAFEPDKQVISGSPITRDITGEEFYSTIYALRESTVRPGVIWVGANDGPVHVTQDNGTTWTKVTPKGLPPGGRVDAVEPSPHAAGKAYIAVLRYQLGDWKPYIYKTTNYGKDWTLLTNGKNGLPVDVPTRVVREDPEREGLLYAGTESGLYISFDDGKNWQLFQQNLPLSPITDIKVYRNDLVLSTMGRGFWILDNLTPLHHPKATNLGKEVVLFPIAKTIRQREIPARGIAGPDYPSHGVLIDYYLPTDSSGSIQLDILDASGQVVNSFVNSAIRQKPEIEEDMGLNSITRIVDRSLGAKKGHNRYRWDMRHQGPWHQRANRSYQNGPMVAPGTYTARLTVGTQTLEQQFELRIDPRLKETGVSESTITEQVKLQLQIVELLSDARKLEEEWTKSVQKLEKKTALLPAEKDELQALKEKLKLLKTEENVIYPQPMLGSQISYLYYMLSGADQQPGKDAYERYEELKVQLEKLKK